MFVFARVVSNIWLQGAAKMVASAWFEHRRSPDATGQLQNAVARRAGFHARPGAVSEQLRLNQAARHSEYAARIRVRSVLSVHVGPTLSALRPGSSA